MSASPVTVNEVKQEREPIVGICGNHLFTAEQSLLHLSRHPTLSTSPLIITATVANIFTKLRARDIDIGIVEIEDSEAGSYRSVYAQLYGDAHPSRSNSISSSGRTTPLPSSTPLSQSRSIVDDGHGEFHGNLYIVGEFAATHEYCLAAVAGVKKEDLQQIYSDAHTLSLFDSYLSNLSDELSRSLDCITCHPPRTARSTATSMTNQKILESQLVDHTELVKSKGKYAAVITTPSHAKRHGLEILESNISLDIPLSTRYVLVSRTPAPLSSVMATHAPIKSSLALSVRNQAGAFFKLLSCFALREINLIKFEARPFCATPTDQFSGRTIRDSIFVLDYEPARFTRRTGTDGQSENSYDNRLNEVLLANLREFAYDVTPLGFYLANSPQVDPSPNWNMSSLL